MALYSGITAKAALEIKDNLRKYEQSMTGALTDLANVTLRAAAQHAIQKAPVHRGEYPPSRERTPGTLKRSISFVQVTDKAPGKLVCDTWLFEWTEGWKARSAAAKAATGRGLKAHKRVGKTRGTGRFASMIRSDPRRVLGEPIERQMNFIKSEKRLIKAAEKAAQDAAIN